MHKYVLFVVERFFSKVTLVRTMLRTQLKQTWKIDLIFQRESTNKGFNEIIFQQFVDELKHWNPDIRMDLQLDLVFLCF